MKLYSQKTSIEPAAGEKYRAKAKDNYRYIVIDQVRKTKWGLQPYVLAHEVLDSGEDATGWHNGMQRDLQIKINLTYRDDLWKLPINYEKLI